MRDLDPFAVPAAQDVAGFMSAVEMLRSRLPESDWRDLVKKSPVLRAWRFLLGNDPYTRWGVVKPRGYAGDATLMDFAYGHRSVQSHIDASGPVGKAIYAATSGAKQSQSARERIQLIADVIHSAVGVADLSVISVAAGHARELEVLPEGSKRRVGSFTAIDLDPVSLQEAERSAGAIPFSAVRRNAIKDGLGDLSPADLVYSLGLFDYLTQEHAQAVMEKMLEITCPGGVCIVANLAPDAANLGYCEAIMDWWMVTRTEREMSELAWSCRSVQEGRFASSVRRVGCFHYLELSSTAAPCSLRATAMEQAG